MSLLFNMLSRLVIAFLPRSKCLLILWLQSSFAVIWEPPKIKSLTISTVSPSNCCVKWWDWMLWLFQNPALQGGLHFYGCAGSVGGLPQLAAVLSWPHLMLLGKRRPIFFGVQCFFFFQCFLRQTLSGKEEGERTKEAQDPGDDERGPLKRRGFPRVTHSRKPQQPLTLRVQSLRAGSFFTTG